MKKLMLLFLLLSFLLQLNAQTWFRDGEKWTYYVTTGFDVSNYGLHGIHIGGDSVVLGQVWKKLIYTQVSQPPFVFLARQSGAQILGLHPFSNQVSTIYDFTKAPGDTVFYGDNRFYTIVDTGSMEAAGQWRKRQIVRFGMDTVSSLLIDQIGMTGSVYNPEHPNYCSFLPIQFAFCEGALDGYSMYFRCYQSPEGGSYSPFNVCLPGAVEDGSDRLEDIFPSPNPCSGQFSIPARLTAIRLYSLKGQLALSRNTEGEFPVQVLTGGLPGGMYVLVGVDVEGKIGCWKIAVEQ